MEEIKAFLGSEALRGFFIGAGVIIALVSVLTARLIARKKQSADLLGCRRIR